MHWLAGNGATATLLLPTLSIALISSLLSLLALKVTDDLTVERKDGNRELVAQGVANAVCGLIGGVPVAGSSATTLASYRSGSRTRWSAAVTSLLLVLAYIAGADLIRDLPLAALAGVMLVIAWDTADFEVFTAVRTALRHRARAHHAWVDLAIIMAVLLASVALNILAGVALGVVISIIVFVVTSSLKVVRRHMTARDRHSLRQRSHDHVACLVERGEEIALLELDGPLFFGTADHLADDVAKLAASARYVVLDCGRISAVDATGAHGVAQIARRLKVSGRELVLAGLAERDRRGQALAHACPDPLVHWFADADRALEWCEDRVLEAAGRQRPDEELPLHLHEFCRELEPAELALLETVLERHAYAAGTVLFHEGDAGSCLYLLARGTVSITLRDALGGTNKRVATFGAGVVFGEMALLEGRPRSADARFDSDGVVFALSRDALEGVNGRAPALISKLYRSLARVLAERLRDTTRELRFVAAQ